MQRFVWPSDDGWPYPDGEAETREELDLTVSDADIDSLSLNVELGHLRDGSTHLFDDLSALEREVICREFGLSWESSTSTMSVPRVEQEAALQSGLGKLRAHLAG